MVSQSSVPNSCLIRRREKDLSEMDWKRLTGDYSIDNLIENMAKLREMDYFATYGNYARRLAHELRAKSLM